MSRSDTIAAIATPPGKGGVGIVRISGPDALRIAQALMSRAPEPRRAHFAHFREVLDGQTDVSHLFRDAG